MKKYLFIIGIILFIIICGVILFFYLNNEKVNTTSANDISYLENENIANIVIAENNELPETNEIEIETPIIENEITQENQVVEETKKESKQTNKTTKTVEKVNEKTKETNKQEVKTEVQTEQKIEKTEETKQVPKEEKTEIKQEETIPEVKEETKQEEPELPKEEPKVELDFSKYDRYYPALNGGYTCFKKNPDEIAKLRKLLEDAIKEFGYTNVKLVEDSSIISNRYFTANKTNAQNAAYNSEDFAIHYYAETEYGLTANGEEYVFQIRSYTKITGQ